MGLGGLQRVGTEKRFQHAPHCIVNSLEAGRDCEQVVAPILASRYVEVVDGVPKLIPAVVGEADDSMEPTHTRKQFVVVIPYRVLQRFVRDDVRHFAAGVRVGVLQTVPDIAIEQLDGALLPLRVVLVHWDDDTPTVRQGDDDEGGGMPRLMIVEGARGDVVEVC